MMDDGQRKRERQEMGQSATRLSQKKCQFLYNDDLAFWAYSKEQLLEITSRWKVWLEDMGLKVNTGKINVMKRQGEEVRRRTLVSMHVVFIVVLSNPMRFNMLSVRNKPTRDGAV
jgi:hypothetical protein